VDVDGVRLGVESVRAVPYSLDEAKEIMVFLDGEEWAVDAPVAFKSVPKVGVRHKVVRRAPSFAIGLVLLTGR